MKIIPVAVAIAGILLNPILLAHAQQKSSIESRFKQWDRNKDGKLTKNELPERARRNFERVDRNMDGTISLEEHKSALSRNRNLRLRDQPRVPDSVKLQRDIAYAETNNPRQMLDLLLPTKRQNDEPLPVIAFIHGGGWRTGNKSTGIRRLVKFVETGQFAAASIAYRLTDEAKWPNQIHDCKAAIRWLRGNATKHGLDPNRIGVWGTSAGGHLVSMLGVSGDVKRLEGTIGTHGDQSSHVSCVVNFFGPTDFLTMDDFPTNIKHNSADSPEGKLIGGAIPANKDKALDVSPINYVTKDDVPFLNVHGTDDRLVPFDQSVQFDKKLKSVGVTSALISVERGGHGFSHREVDRLVYDFFAKHLNGKEVAIDDQTVKVRKQE